MSINKDIVLIMLCVLTISTGFSQVISIYSIDDKLPIAFANVQISGVSEMKTKNLISNSNGEITLNATFNQYPYIIRIQTLGFESFLDTIHQFSNKTFYLTPSQIKLNEFVVTAQYAPGSTEKAVHKIRVIDSEKIEAMGAVNLRDVLTNELNIRLSQDNILGSKMSIQGVSGLNVKILIDGVPVIGRLDGNIDISQINLYNVERIEIVQGPLSVNYGTDALGGTINIITKKNQRESLSISSQNYYESIGQYNTTGRIGYRKNKNTISFDGGRNYFDGWRQNDRAFLVEKPRLADSARFMDWKPKEQYFGTLNLLHQFNKLNLNYTGDYFYEQVMNRGLPRSPYQETAFDDYYNTNRINNSFNLGGPINSKYRISILAAYNYFQRIKNTFYKDLTTLDQVLSDNPSDQDTTVFHNLMSRGNISSSVDSAKVNYEIGYDIIHETALGIRIKDSKQQIGDYAIFTTLEYNPLKGLTIRPGLRLIYNTAYKAPIVPSVNMKYVLQNNENDKTSIILRGSYARGFRSPSLKELHFYFVDINHNITGNENLKAEQSHNFNVAITGNFFNKKWITDISVFSNYIENMISLAQSTNTQYSYFNLDRFQSQGIQVQNEFGLGSLKISMGAAYIGRYNHVVADLTNEKFLYTPEVNGNLFYLWEKQNLTFALFYKYTGKLPGFGITLGDEIYKTEIQEYHMADLSISKSFLKEKLSLTLGSKNIFDVKNISGVSAGAAHSSGSSNIPVAMGRTFFMKLILNLSTKN